MEGSDGAIRHVRQLVAQQPDRFFYADQYSNPSNPKAHELTTGKEIWEQTRGTVTHLVAGIGTGGTIMGTGRNLEAYRPSVPGIALEPLEALPGPGSLQHLPSSIHAHMYKER